MIQYLVLHEITEQVVTMIALVVRKLSISGGGSKPCIMTSGELRLDLQTKAEQRTVYPSGSPSHSQQHTAISPTGLSSLLPTISSRFNVGKSKDPSSSSGGKKQKKKSSKNSSTSASSPAQARPACALSE